MRAPLVFVILILWSLLIAFCAHQGLSREPWKANPNPETRR